jgi:hypothetical protein
MVVLQTKTYFLSPKPPMISKESARAEKDFDFGFGTE